ncbi:Uncharacterized protein BM_BM14119 [Brugia malayi]|uniref:Bm14119 n=1 Tax=Brugia malayi TaxID=6279 RepID=A0A0J9XN09_BRUMA|nr:Uncharacterized protein BM_BM14119 [Brugia malayi]CDP91461.1 Bm14119 [Brugia malayi]VIO87902.1 Uncharacterized protein BM_BM14119 [Brugia malayi]
MSEIVVTIPWNSDHMLQCSSTFSMLVFQLKFAMQTQPYMLDGTFKGHFNSGKIC